MAAGLLNQKDLEEWTGYQRPADIEKFLTRKKIPFDYGKGGTICTTQAAVDRGILGEKQEKKTIAF